MYIHNSCDGKTSTTQTLTQYNCGICGKTFQTKSDFMKHRRKDHSDKVPECRDHKNDCCRFQKETCWFKHEEKLEIKSPDMVERLFNMMEKFSERMEMMESQLYN